MPGSAPCSGNLDLPGSGHRGLGIGRTRCAWVRRSNHAEGLESLGLLRGRAAYFASVSTHDSEGRRVASWEVIWQRGDEGMTPTEREFGRLEAEIQQLVHRSRNDRQVLMGLQEELEALSLAVERLRARLTAAVGVAVALAGVIAWLVDVAITVGQ